MPVTPTPGDAVYYVSGPASIFIRTPTPGFGPYEPIPGVAAPALPSTIRPGGTLVNTSNYPVKFLGHCEVSPKPQFEAIYKEVKSSTSGEGVSDDKVFLGETAKVELDLARFNWTVANIVANHPRHGRGPSTLGNENYLDRGLLMIRNGMTFEMWIRFEFFGTANAAAYPDLPIGWYFPACIAVGQYPDNLTRDTTKMKFFIEPQNVPIGPAGGWFLYSQLPAFFAPLPPFPHG